jgi:hypothetical protein
MEPKIVIPGFSGGRTGRKDYIRYYREKILEKIKKRGVFTQKQIARDLADDLDFMCYMESISDRYSGWLSDIREGRVTFLSEFLGKSIKSCTSWNSEIVLNLDKEQLEEIEDSVDYYRILSCRECPVSIDFSDECSVGGCELQKYRLDRSQTPDCGYNTFLEN